MGDMNIRGAGDSPDCSRSVNGSIQNRRRGNGGILTLPSLPRAFVGTPSTEETICEGESLFYNFINEEIAREFPNASVDQMLNGFSNGEVPPSPLVRISTAGSSSSSAITEMANELLAIADKFRESDERMAVMRMSEDFPLDITRDRFLRLLGTVFEGGMTKERFIVVFFFCRDVAIRALKRHALNYFKMFIVWSVEFIKDRVCAWVQANGGWGQVLGDSLNYAYKVLKAACVVAVLSAACIYVVRNVRKG